MTSDITFRTKSTSRKKLELRRYRSSRSVKIFLQSPLNSLQKACTLTFFWMKLSTHPESTVARMIYNILPCCNSSCCTRLSIYLKKNSFQIFDAGKCHFSQYFHFTHPDWLKTWKYSQWTPEKAHSACSTSNWCVNVRPLKNTATYILMFLNKDPLCGWGNEVTQERSCDMPDCFLVCFVKNIKYFAECQILQYLGRSSQILKSKQCNPLICDIKGK